MKRWFLSIFGYLIYILIVLVFLLWWRFPAGEVASWCENRLQARYPTLIWKIDSLRWAFPNRIVIEEIRATPKSKPDTEMIHVKELELILDPVSLVRKNRRINYRMHLYEGIGKGRILVNGNNDISCQGQFTGLNLAEAKGLAASLNRTIRGQAGGTFSWIGSWPGTKTAKISGMIHIEDGLLPLRKPVLGLKQLTFSRLESSVRKEKNVWILDKGRLEAKTMLVLFKGKIIPGPDLARAKLALTGSLTPRSELFKSVGNREMVAVIRGFLRNGALRFMVSGTAAEPSVQFPGGLSRAMRRFRPQGGRQ